jgi:endonuclease/exonuclease/phosphatase family metal-dependent hydrolase
MRLVTWNVQTARPNPDGPADVDRVVARLRALDPDVVALQEVDRGLRRSGGVDQGEAIAVGLGGRLVWAPTVRRGQGSYGHGLIVVRGEVVRVRDVPLGGTREPRTLLVAELDHEGRRWTVGATHLSRRRRCAKEQLARCLDELAALPEPRVLLGDLNLTPRHVLPWSTAAGFQLVDGPPTHSTRHPIVMRKIDHVLVSGAQVTASATHHLDVSDHRAVAATLA